jgi:predicted short-subunit dehydrogenase-like oxidoreductase (DUF2520 family)
MEVVFIGSGNVATQLGLALKAKGVIIKQVYSKSYANAEILAKKLDAEATSDTADIYMDADFYFYALKDTALRSTLKKLEIPSGIHVHTGGSISIREFEGFMTRFGVFYPLQTFSVNKLVDFSVIPICIEACNQDVQEKLTALGGLISQKVIMLNSESRRKLHLAAVFACNFSNYMYDVASQILESSGIPFDIMYPLITETTEKIKTMKPYEAQTGPAVRLDDATIAKHLDMLSKKKDFKNIYKVLTKSINNRHKYKN